SSSLQLTLRTTPHIATSRLYSHSYIQFRTLHSFPTRRSSDLDRAKNTGPGKKLTDDAGFKISNDRWSLRAGKRGPTLFQDFHFYKKQSHFNRERIPEKVVHARGDGIYGELELYK